MKIDERESIETAVRTTQLRTVSFGESAERAQEAIVRGRAMSGK